VEVRGVRCVRGVRGPRPRGRLARLPLATMKGRGRLRTQLYLGLPGRGVSFKKLACLTSLGWCGQVVGRRGGLGTIIHSRADNFAVKRRFAGLRRALRRRGAVGAAPWLALAELGHVHRRARRPGPAAPARRVDTAVRRRRSAVTGRSARYGSLGQRGRRARPGGAALRVRRADHRG